MAKRVWQFVVPVAVAVVFGLLSFVQFYSNAGERLYDLFLRFRSPIPEREEILLLDVDDTAITNVGLWPWSRDYMANGLILLRELGARAVVFDILYADSSPRAVDARYLTQELPEQFAVTFDSIVDQVDSLVAAITAGQIPVADAPEFVPLLAESVENERQQLLSSVDAVVEDYDAYLGDAARFNGSAYFTVNIIDYEELTATDTADVASTVALERVEATSDESLRVGTDVLPTIEPILRGGLGAGFPNVVVDPDGVQRRIDLLARVGDEYYGQLVLTPLIDWLGITAVEARTDRVVLRDALIPGADERVDITIPTATDGRMLINWPPAEYLETFRHLSYWQLIYDWQTEAEMVELLRDLMPNLARYYPNSDSLLPLYDFAESMKQDVLSGADSSQVDDWAEYRRIFFDELAAFVASDTADVFRSDINAAIASGEYAEDVIPQLEEIRDSVDRFWNALQARHEGFAENRARLREEIPGSFIVIGWVGTSTTDVGVTPFDEEYMNVGTHASVANTIMQQSFLDDTPWWVSVGSMFLLSVIVTAISIIGASQRATRILIIGFVALVVIAGGGILLFVQTGIYVDMVTLLAGVLVTFIALTVVKFIEETKQKQSIRNAFGHYMSEEVVRQVTEDPAKLALGGVKKHLTAMFTDIRGFSTISESLEPDRLTDLLNQYLGAMCDIILKEGGTIDKFEGDAIIAFWGAPIDQEDSAVRACRAAIQMKKVEAELNERFMATQMAPNPLFTRIGVNTGDMVVGNMGTETRMDYTAMGHNMNLAARLEGVNKQYGTWVLVSEQTYRETSNEETRFFTVRKLDRVRVVGISEPVRLYELIDTRAEIDKQPEIIEKLRTFNSGLTAFEEKDWSAAERCFTEVLDKYPEDGPAKYYVDRCKAFKKRAPARDWDGVFNLTKK